MSTIIPFKGLRPRPDLAKSVASPPYDVVDSEQARRMVVNNPNSFLHVIKPEIDLSRDINPTDPAVYAQGGKNLAQFIKQNVLIQDKNPYFYIYEQIMGTHRQAGLVACASVDEYIGGKIKKHEHTQKQKVRDRVKLMQALNAQTGPVFVAYRQDEEIQMLFDEGMSKQPVYDFIGDNDVHLKFYIVEDETLIHNIQSAFKNVAALYIADGHHRSEAAAEFCIQQRSANNDGIKRACDYFLTVIFPASDLLILPYNRVVKDLNNFSKSELLSKIEKRFSIEEAVGDFHGPQYMKQFGLYIDTNWHILSPLPSLLNSKDLMKELDVAILQDNILGPILGIQDPRVDSRIKFVGGMNSIQVIEHLVDCGEFAVGFSLYPTDMQQVMSVADAGYMMPPKSTWFEPKLLSGLVTHVLD